MGIVKKILIVLVFLLFVSPVLVIFLSFSKAEELDRLLNKLPFYSKISQEHAEMVQKVIDIPDQWRSNFFLPGQNYSLTIPEGFDIAIFASRLGKVRMLDLSESGDLYASIYDEGKIVVLPDADEDGYADDEVIFASNLTSPNGIQIYQGWVYVAVDDGIIRLHDDDGDMKADQQETVISDLEINGGSTTKELLIDEQGNIYITMPASCNACEEGDDRRATILKFNSDGSNKQVFASGIKSSLGLAINPQTGQLWASDSARGDLGDQMPQDELNVIDSGMDFGWPQCYGDNEIDLNFNPNAADDACADQQAPAVLFRAHTGPAGMQYITSQEMPKYMQNKFVLALHGSDLSTVPTGCQIVMVDPTAAEADQVNDLITGWIVGTDTRGRPIDVVQSGDRDLFISDDYSGTIYRLTYSE